LVAVVVYGHQPSASTQNMTGASAVTTALKTLSPQTLVLMVGGHVAALPARTLAEERCDFVARDEGLHTCVDLLSALESATPALAGVRGLVYRSDGRVVSNPAAPLVLRLDDEMFVLNQRHVLGICDLLIERGYDLNIWAYARVDTVKEGMLDKLKRAGFNWLALGIEAANERVLTDVDKRYRVDEVYDTVRRIKAAGINNIGNYIFGLPEDTAETMQDTLDL